MVVSSRLQLGTRTAQRGAIHQHRQQLHGAKSFDRASRRVQIHPRVEGAGGAAAAARGVVRLAAGDAVMPR